MKRTIRTLNNLLIAFAFAAVSPAFAAGLDTQKNSHRGVTVAVTPQNLSGGAKTWDFKIVLDTHSADLNDDPMKSAVLLDGAGGKRAPLAWDGAPPGGHHREGVLRFQPITPAPPAVELQLQRPGESAPRVFRWDLK